MLKAAIVLLAKTLAKHDISFLYSGQAKGVRFETPERICAVLGCQPGDLLEYQPDDD